MQTKFTTLRLVILLNFITAMAFAQAPAQGNINQLISKIGNYSNAMPIEKVFLQFDKPYYSTGDTIWFKGYLMNQSIGYSPLSSRLYVELLNDSNAVIRRFVFPAAYGITWGSIPLDRTYIHDGTYTIRAYTNWMRNFGDDYFFKQGFYINNQGEHTWLVNAQPSLASLGGKDDIKLALKFTDLDNKTAANDLQLKVINNKKVLLRNTAQTGADGIMNVDFTVPSQTALKNLNVLVVDKADKTRSVIIPVKVNRPQDVDIQFMPESGPLVTGIPSHVGFKAVGEDGKGIAVQGTLYDNDRNELAQLTTPRYGMGTFNISPQPGKTYTAEFDLPGGGKKIVSLPQALKTGSVLSIRNNMDRDTISVALYNTAEQADAKYYLVGIGRGVVCYAASFTFKDNYFSVKVPKALFPTGVAHFILFNAANQPLNERVTFIDRHDRLNIEVKTDSKSFVARDSIPVHITVKDETGAPVVGSFSLAVTDDNQVKPGSSSSDNIMTHLLLSSDIKGYVEDPAFYFKHDAQSWAALDALLLTQGWVGYDLKKINQPLAKPQFDPEVEFSVKGTVTNLFNKPVSDSKVLLLSKGDQNFFKDTVSDKQGKFVFNKFPRIEKSTFIISARNARGRVVNGGISVDEKNQSPVSSGSIKLLDPWNVNTDTTVLNYVRSDKKYQTITDRSMYDAQGRLLKSVTIRDQGIVRNSKNLNGPGTADQTLTEDVLVNAGKASLLDVLNSKVSGFRNGFYKDSAKKTNLEFFLKDKRVHFVFDGVDIDRFYEPFAGIPNEHYDYQKQYLDNVSAEDILGIEVIYSRNARYNTTNLSTDDLLAADPTGPRGSDIAYLEITTRAGNGPFLQRATGIYIYKPLALAEYKKFYRPRYAVKGNITGTDIRSTIHWEPNIITDKNGMSTISFYAADKPTRYTIICEGSDMNGKVGTQTADITITK
ncbi:MAG: hypothetical protein ACXVAY_15615 [Mucilaginibacter sp.]